MNSIPNDNEEVIRAKLRSRLDEVRRKVADNSYGIEVKELSNPKYSGSEVENILKEFMLAEMNSLRDSNWQEEHRNDFYDSLNQLYRLALNGDLRFLDAFNRSYEELKEIRPEEFETDRGQKFLTLYRQLINRFLERLSR